MSNAIDIKQIMKQFNLESNAQPYGNGHINDTFLMTLRKDDGTEGRVILQGMNKKVFKQPVELMENIMGVTTFIRNKVIENGGDPEREALNAIGPAVTQEQSPAFLRNTNGRLDFPGPTQEAS